MNKYEEEVFQFITKEENFETAFEIYQKMPAIKNKLIENFWKSVMNNLTSKIMNTDFKAKISSNVFETYSKCYLFLDGLGDFRIQYEKLYDKVYLGLWVWDGSEVERRLSKEKDIYNILRSDKILNGWSQNKWWWAWKYTTYDFNAYETLKKTLLGSPDLDSFAEEVAADLFNLAVEFVDLLRKITTEYKKL